MKETHDYQRDIESIRSMMERSAKFLSLSGLSGVLAGVYALLGAAAAYYLLYYPNPPYGVDLSLADDTVVFSRLVPVAAVVLMLALATAYYMSARNAMRSGASIWNKASKELVINLFIPLIAGGLWLLILLTQGHMELIVPACLIFYGLALISASPLTVNEIRYLGFTEIVLGLVAALLPGFGLLLWAAGFGFMHILYGSIMYYRYDT